MTRTVSTLANRSSPSRIVVSCIAVSCIVVSCIAVSCIAAADVARANDARISLVTVSRNGRIVYGRTKGERVRLLRSCPREVFFGASGSATAPRVSPNGRYVILERLWPYEAHGRVDESTVLLDTRAGRTYASGYYGRRFATGVPIATTWVRGRPATLEVEGDVRTRRIALPGVLVDRAAPDRCASR